MNSLNNSLTGQKRKSNEKTVLEEEYKEEYKKVVEILNETTKKVIFLENENKLFKKNYEIVNKMNDVLMENQKKYINSYNDLMQENKRYKSSFENIQKEFSEYNKTFNDKLDQFIDIYIEKDNIINDRKSIIEELNNINNNNTLLYQLSDTLYKEVKKIVHKKNE